MAKGELKGAGSIKIDGVSYQLAKEKNNGGFFWHYTSQSAAPAQLTPEESVLSTVNSGYKRTAGWLDWSHGGVGPSLYQANVRWLSWSEGPQTEYARRIFQPMGLQDLSYPLVGIPLADYVYGDQIASDYLVAGKTYIISRDTGYVAGSLPINSYAETSNVNYTVGSIFTCYKTSATIAAANSLVVGVQYYISGSTSGNTTQSDYNIMAGTTGVAYGSSVSGTPYLTAVNTGYGSGTAVLFPSNLRWSFREIVSRTTDIPDGYYPIYSLGDTGLSVWQSISYDYLNYLFVDKIATPSNLSYVPYDNVYGVPPTVIEYSMNWTLNNYSGSGGFIHTSGIGGGIVGSGTQTTKSLVYYGTGKLAVSRQNELSGEPDIFTREKGDIVAFAQSPDGIVFTVQQRGDVRRVVFAQSSSVADISVTMSALPVVSTVSPNTNFGSSNGFSLRSDIVNLTEGSQIWSVSGVNGTLTNYLLLGAEPQGQGTGGMFRYANGVWQQASSVSRSRWATGVYSDGPTLWGASAKDSTGSVALFNLKWKQDPFLEANWSTDLFNVGGVNTSFVGRAIGTNNLSKITSIAVLRDSVVVAIEDGMFYRVPTVGNLAGIAIPMIDPKSASADSDSGKTMGVWSGTLFIPTVRGLFMYDEFSGKDGGTFVGAGPEFIRGNQSPIRGKAVLYTGDPEYLYASFYNGTDSYVMKGRLAGEKEEAPGTMIWHAACPYLKNEKVTAITIVQPQVSNVSNPVLLVASTAVSGRKHLRFCVLPRPGRTFLTDDITKSSITTAGRFAAILPDHDAMAPSVYKNFLRINIVSKNLSYTNTISVSYRVDDGPWIFLQRISTSPFVFVPLPLNTMGYKIGLKFVFNGSDDSLYTYLEAVSFDFTSASHAAKTVNAQVYIAKDQGAYSGRSRFGVIGRLELLDRLKDEVQTFEVVGPDNQLHYAQFDPTIGVSWRPIEQADQDNEGTQGFVATFRLNIYDDYIAPTVAVYDSTTAYYTEDGNVSYYSDTPA